MGWICPLVLWFLSILVINIISAEENGTFDFNSPLGRIKGSFITTRLGRRIYSFRGMRYGESPVGDRRFRPAELVKPWKEVFDASIEGPGCPQPNAPLVSEDCLRLNVYLNQLPSRMNPVRKPVIVYIHPGVFYKRSGQSYLQGPQYLLDKEVVLVVINYRLASFGFISTGDSFMPGNLGLKDQVLALRWIKKYISAFGGDPDSVTLAGYSAGSWSVSLHLVSPMSKGLFHKAIAMSGSAIFQTPLPRHQRDLAIKQAKMLNCPTNDSESILNCLKIKSTEEIVNSLPKFFDSYGNPAWLWFPVIEPDVAGVERFLHDDPAKLIREGKFAQVPLIGGVTKDELGGSILVAKKQAGQKNFSIFDNWNTNWDQIAPTIFIYEKNSSRSIDISEKLYSFYNHDKPITLNNLQGMSGLYRDALISFSQHRLMNLLAASSCQPVFYYHFIYQGRYSHTIDPETKKPFGVLHTDDFMYIFYIKQFPFFQPNDPEIRTVERITAIWENFARTGNPIPGNNRLFKNVTWKKFTPRFKRYLEIGNELTMRNGVINPKEMKLWDRLFPLSSV